MAEIVYTVCDRCCPGVTNIGDKIRRSDARGWAAWSETDCVEFLGWEHTPEGIICPECQDESEGQQP